MPWDSAIKFYHVAQRLAVMLHEHTPSPHSALITTAVKGPLARAGQSRLKKLGYSPERLGAAPFWSKFLKAF